MSDRYRSGFVQRLKPIADQLSDVADQWAKGKSDDELAQLAKDVERLKGDNCYAHFGDAKALIAEAVRGEQARRAWEREANDATQIEAKKK